MRPVPVTHGQRLGPAQAASPDDTAGGEIVELFEISACPYCRSGQAHHLAFGLGDASAPSPHLEVVLAAGVGPVLSAFICRACRSRWQLTIRCQDGYRYRRDGP
jgi:hypothetical protein